MDETERFAAMMRRSASLKLRVATELAPNVLGVVAACETCLRAGGKLLFCGNGGSAADSQHLATEMLIRLRGSRERPSYAAIALTLDPAAPTACGNDYGYDRVYNFNLGKAGDSAGLQFAIWEVEYPGISLTNYGNDLTNTLSDATSYVTDVQNGTWTLPSNWQLELLYVGTPNGSGVNQNLAYVADAPLPAPEPASLALLAVGLIGLAGLRLRRQDFLRGV
jgi:hypothetical protein